MIVPLLSALNFTPNSTALSGPSSVLTGVAVIGQMVQLLLHTVVIVMLRGGGVYSCSPALWPNPLPSR